MKSKRKIARKAKESSRKKDESASAPSSLDDDNSNHDAIGQSSHTIPLFSLILHRSVDPPGSTDPPRQKCVTLLSGMVLLRNLISIDDQVKIVNTCQNFGMGPGGFYQAGGRKLHMMCFGRNWDPHKKYDARCRSEAPPIPAQLLSFAETALQKAQEDESIPSMQPDICIVNFYTTNDRLGLHQDRDESSDSLDKGLPVVSISIGDSAQFLYAHHKNAMEARKVMLNSGDVLIFGGESRHIYHGVTEIYANTAPHSLLEKSMLRPGRLNLTFRQY